MALDVKIHADATNAAEQLKKMREAGLLAKDSVRGLAEAAEMLGANVGGMVQTVMLAREGLMALRAAALATGASLAAVSIPLAAAGALVAVGIGIWKAYKDGLAEVGVQAEKTSKNIKEMGDMMQSIQTLRKAGAMTKKDQDFLNAFMVGAVPASKAPDPSMAAALKYMLDHPSELGLPNNEWSPEVRNRAAVKRLLMERGDILPSGEMTAQESAKIGIKGLLRDIPDMGETDDFSNKLTEISKKYHGLRDQAQVWGEEAFQAGKTNRGEIDRMLKGLDEAEQREIRNADIERQTNMMRGQKAPDLAKIASEETADQERKLTMEALEHGH